MLILIICRWQRLPPHTSPKEILISVLDNSLVYTALQFGSESHRDGRAHGSLCWLDADVK